MNSLRAADLALTGFGVPSTVARAEIRTLTAAERARRALTAVGLGLLLALLTLPIPVVHLFFPLFALVSGVVLGVRRFGQRELFHRVEGTCPFCGRAGRLGLAGSPVRLPREVSCPDCRKTLDLELPRTGG